MTNMVDRFNQSQIEKVNEIRNFNVPSFRVGDLISVVMKIKDGAKERAQKFEGRCIDKKNKGLHSSFRLRKSNGSDGVEMVFSVFSPFINSIEVVKTGKVRRANISYMRHLSAKKSRIAERDVYKKPN
jgi:large subunit ribosomal protein L19